MELKDPLHITFNQLGVIKIDKKEVSDERILELAIELVLMSVYQIIDFMKFIVLMNEIYNIKKELEKEIENFISTEIEWIPLNNVEVSKEKNDDLINFFESLEDDDDVQNIYSNVEFIKIDHVNYWNRPWNFWIDLLF